MIVPADWSKTEMKVNLGRGIIISQNGVELARVFLLSDGSHKYLHVFKKIGVEANRVEAVMKEPGDMLLLENVPLDVRDDPRYRPHRA